MPSSVPAANGEQLPRYLRSKGSTLISMLRSLASTKAFNRAALLLYASQRASRMIGRGATLKVSFGFLSALCFRRARCDLDDFGPEAGMYPPIMRIRCTGFNLQTGPFSSSFRFEFGARPRNIMAPKQEVKSWLYQAALGILNTLHSERTVQ